MVIVMCVSMKTEVSMVFIIGAVQQEVGHCRYGLSNYRMIVMMIVVSATVFHMVVTTIAVVGIRHDHQRCVGGFINVGGVCYTLV